MRERQEVQTAMQRLLPRGLRVRSAWTEQDGARIHHLECGSGPALILLHGGTGGGANWFRMIGPLAEGFRVLAPDLPGFGLSDPIPVITPLGRTAADRLLGWMERQDISSAIAAGTSFGGLVALRLAQQTTRIERLLLLDTAGLGRRIHPSVRFAAGSPFTAWSVRPTRRGTALVFGRLLTSNLTGISAVEQELLVDYLYASARVAGTEYLSLTLRRFAGVGGQREVLSDDELSALEQPVSIVWGARDRLLPVAHAYRAVQRIPAATVRVLPRIGHSPNWEQPGPVIDAIRELSFRRVYALPDRPPH